MMPWRPADLRANIDFSPTELRFRDSSGVPKLADRGLDIEEFGDVSGERGGNEIPQSGSYAGLR